MAFINSFSTIIRKSNQEIVHIFGDDNINFNFFDKDKNISKKASIKSERSIDLSSCNFSLSKDDSIYGIYNDNSLKIIEIKNNSNKISIKDILNYNINKSDILYPYVEFIDNDIHIFYYMFNNKSNTSCSLYHHYNTNGVWRECKIDYIYNTVLNNFEIVWINNSPIIFYFSMVNGYEEIFFSRFNKYKLKWSKPYQITNSKKSKLYLSVLYDKGIFNITFCESENNLYSVKYINGNIDNKDSFNLNISNFVSYPSICMFPNIVKEKNDINILWVDFNKLYKSKTIDLGKNFTNPVVDNYSLEDDFCKSKFLSNYKNDFQYKSSNIFSIFNDISIIGI